jgi:LacI family transcriptional regulator
MNPFFTKISRAVEDTMQNQGYILMLGNTDESADKEARYLHALIARRVDGVILSPAASSRKSVELLRQHDIPTVLVERKVGGTKVDTVVTDSFDAGRQLAQHFIDRGYRDIVFVGGREDVSTLQERLAGYCTVLEREGFTPDYHLGEYDQQSGYEIMERLLQSRDAPEEVIAANNFVGIGAIKALCEQGLTIPNDIGLACFGDLGAATTINPILTAIVHPAYEIGRKAAKMLSQRMDGYAGLPREEILPVELVVRKSTLPANDLGAESRPHSTSKPPLSPTPSS